MVLVCTSNPMFREPGRYRFSPLARLKWDSSFGIDGIGRCCWTRLQPSPALPPRCAPLPWTRHSDPELMSQPCSPVSPCALSIPGNTALRSPGQGGPSGAGSRGCPARGRASAGCEAGGVRVGDEAAGRAAHEGRERGGAGRRRGTERPEGGREGPEGGREGPEEGPGAAGLPRSAAPPGAGGAREGGASRPPLSRATPRAAILWQSCVSGQRRSLRSCQLPAVRRAAPSMASFPPTVNEKLIGEGRARRGSGTGAGGLGSAGPQRGRFGGRERRGRCGCPPCPPRAGLRARSSPGPRRSPRPAAEAAAAINGQDPVKLHLGVKCSHIFL